MNAIETRQKYKAEIRELILATAREIFVHEGYQSFTLRTLAGRIGYAPSAIYKHFKNKREIFDCLVAESFVALFRAVEKVRKVEGEDPVDWLKRRTWAYVTFGLENPNHYRFAFLLQPVDAEHPSKPPAAYNGLREDVQSCIDAGKIKQEDKELIAQALWAVAHGITSLLIQKPSFPWVARRKLIARVIDSAIQGLLAPDKPPNRAEGEKR